MSRKILRRTGQSLGLTRPATARNRRRHRNPAESRSASGQTRRVRAPTRSRPGPAFAGFSRLHRACLALRVLAGGLAAVVMVNWNRWVGGAGPQWTDDAALAADLTPLSAQVGGRISAVPVNDFQPVHAGTLLARIDDAPFRAQLAQAEASVAAAGAAIANLQAQERLQAANIAAAQAQLEGRAATAVRNRLEAERQHRLLATRIAGTEQAVEQADAAAKLADAQVSQAGANVEAAQRQLDVQHTQEAQLAANLKAAQAALDLAQHQSRLYPIAVAGRWHGGTASRLSWPVCRHRHPGHCGGAAAATSTSSPTTRRPSSPTCSSASRPRSGSTLSPAWCCMATCILVARHRLAVRAAAARQCDRQLHQGRAADPGARS